MQIGRSKFLLPILTSPVTARGIINLGAPSVFGAQTYAASQTASPT